MFRNNKKNSYDFIEFQNPQGKGSMALRKTHNCLPGEASPLKAGASNIEK